MNLKTSVKVPEDEIQNFKFSTDRSENSSSHKRPNSAGLALKEENGVKTHLQSPGAGL